MDGKKRVTLTEGVDYSIKYTNNISSSAICFKRYGIVQRDIFRYFLLVLFKGEKIDLRKMIQMIC